MKDLLQSLGYDVKISNEYDAITQVEEYLPSIVIANFIMKKVTGDKLIEKIKKVKPDTWCILSSSNSINLESYRAFNVDAVMQTPISEEKLKDALNIKKMIKFCPYCGENLKEIKRAIIYCPNCGEKLQ